MRFDCGPTWRERIDHIKNWNPWFAWHPVRITDTRECVWLETVERQGSFGYAGLEYTYRLKDPTP